MQSYKVVTAFNCPKQGSYPIEFKSCSPGMIFTGILDETNKPPIIKDAEGFVIPMANVYPIDAESEKYSSQASSQPPTKLPQDIQEKLDNTINRDIVDNLLNSSKSTTTGAMVGAIIGILAGLYFEKNILLTGVSGLIVGGYLGRKINNQLIINKTNNANEA